MSVEALRTTLHLIGGISASWSVVEYYWLLIFRASLQPLSPQIADAIYFQFKTFDNQTALTIAAIKAKFGDESEQAQQIGKLYADKNKLAGRRNSAAHMLLSVTGPNEAATIIAHQGAHPTKPNKLAGTDLNAELLSICKDVDKHQDHLHKYLMTNAPQFLADQKTLAELTRLGVYDPDDGSAL